MTKRYNKNVEEVNHKRKERRKIIAKKKERILSMVLFERSFFYKIVLYFI